jgi:HlyD family secretion protein
METQTTVDTRATAATPPAPDGPARTVFEVQRDGGRQRARERRATLMRYTRRALLAALVAAGAVASVLALRPRAVPVDVARAARGKLVVAVEETGVTRVKDRYVVSVPATGTLSRLALEAGDEVAENDVLAEIAPATAPLLDARTRSEAEARLGAALSASGQARAQVGRATAARDLAEQELARVRRLVTSGAMPRQALEQAAFDAKMRAEELSSTLFAGKVAAEQVRLARAALGRGGEGAARGRHLDVLAPVSGRVLRVHQKSAGVVSAGAPLLEIGDPAKLEIVVDFLTTDAVKLQSGTEVMVRGWGRDDTLAGRVRTIEPSAFTRPSALGVDEQRVNVIIVITEPRERWAALGDGYRVEARLVLWRADDVLKAPQGAVFRHGDRWAAYRVTDGVARLAPVDIGHRGDTEVEILSGLSPGDAVAVHPGDRVKDGARVEAR